MLGNVLNFNILMIWILRTTARATNSRYRLFLWNDKFTNNFSHLILKKGDIHVLYWTRSACTLQTFIKHRRAHFWSEFLSFFSSPEPKAQVSFSDQNLSVVRRCRRCRRCRRRRRKLFTFSSSSPEPLG